MKGKILGWQMFLVLTLGILLLLFGASRASASNIRGGDSVVIGQGEVIDDDLILFGNTIVVNGTVNGDLIAFGNQVTLNGTVDGSTMIGGQWLAVNGTVKGTLYAGGSELHLNPTASIGRNVMFGGYSLQTEPGSTIARDLTVGAAQATLAGKVGRDVLFGGQALELNGEVVRNVRAEVAEPNQMPMMFNYSSNMPPAIPPGLRVHTGSKIGGQLTYLSTVDQATGILAQPTGGIVFQQQQVGVQETATLATNEWLWTRVRDFATVLILGLLAIWLIPKWMKTAVEQAQAKPLAATGWGLVMLVGGFLIALLALIIVIVIGIVVGSTTLGGLATAVFGVGLGGFALYVTLFTGLALWGAKVVVGSLIGKLVLQGLAKQYADNAILALLIGLVLFELVAAIPVLGGVLTLVVILLGLGAMWYVYYAHRKTMQVSPPRPAPIPA